MQELAQKHTDRLHDLKKKVKEAHEYFEENNKRYNEFTRFVCKTSIDAQERGALQQQQKPTIEFNILEAYINRLRGEFAKQTPALTARVADGVPLNALTEELTMQVEVVQAHLQAIFSDGSNDMLPYNIIGESYIGGYSVMKTGTEYVNEMSFEQNIFVSRVFDPTLCFFDPMARDSHKGDGQFCGEIYPLTSEQFEAEYGENMASEMKFTKSVGDFNWSFKNDTQEIVLVCDFYEKKVKKTKIIKLSNGHVCTEKRYKEFLIEWERRGHLEQPPLPVGQPRWTNIETICRYRLCENKVLDYVETDFKYLPLVFVDGNSVVVNDFGKSEQMTRPYVYHAQGIQRLKNYAGQSLANELENTLQNKFLVPKEAIVKEYQEAWKMPQKAQSLIYNGYIEVNGEKVPCPPPREVNRTPIPPEISGTFRMSDEMTQAILGSYDGAAGVNRADVSGIAFARSAIQSNNASMPYIVGYIKALNRVAEIVLDLIPKYYRTPRSLPILKPDGKRSHVEINKHGSIYMNYDPNHMEIKVDVGVNFAMQKEIALQTIIALTQASPQFAKFMGTNGLPILLDNIDIKGIDGIKEQAKKFMEQENQAQQAEQQAQQQQMQAQAMQMQKQAQVEDQRVQMEMQQAQKVLASPTVEELGLMSIQEKSKVDAATLAIKERDSETKFLETMMKVEMSGAELDMKAAQQDGETAREGIKAVVELAKLFEREKEND